MALSVFLLFADLLKVKVRLVVAYLVSNGESGYIRREPIHLMPSLSGCILSTLVRPRFIPLLGKRISRREDSEMAP